MAKSWYAWGLSENNGNIQVWAGTGKFKVWLYTVSLGLSSNPEKQVAINTSRKEDPETQKWK